MISAITPEPAISGTTNLSDYRYRPAMGERSMLPDSTRTAPKNPSASDNGRFPQEQRRAPAQPQPELPQRDSSSIFVAAMIAGALSPTPKSMEELVRRIGNNPIPAEYEARLKDLMA